MNNSNLVHTFIPKRNATYVLYSLFAIALWGVTIYWITALIADCRNDIDSTKEHIKVYLFILLGFTPIKMIVDFRRNYPDISIFESKIVFDQKETFYWADLEFISLSGTKPYRTFSILTVPAEGIMLQFKGNKKKYISMRFIPIT